MFGMFVILVQEILDFIIWNFFLFN